MSYLLEFVVMAALIVAVVLLAHAWTQSLRRKGYGDRLDKLYYWTLSSQSRLGISLGRILRSTYRPRSDRPLPPHDSSGPDPGETGTKKD